MHTSTDAADIAALDTLNPSSHVQLKLFGIECELMPHFWHVVGSVDVLNVFAMHVHWSRCVLTGGEMAKSGHFSQLLMILYVFAMHVHWSRCVLAGGEIAKSGHFSHLPMVLYVFAWHTHCKEFVLATGEVIAGEGHDLHESTPSSPENVPDACIV